MANVLFDSAREAFLNEGAGLTSGAIQWGTGAGGDDIRVVFVDTGTYTPVPGTDVYLAVITDAAMIGENGVALTSDAAITANTPSLTNKTVTNGTADADDVTLTAVSGATVENIIIFKWTGTEVDSPLIARIDTATGMTPLTPNGGDVTIAWDSGADRIFTL